MYMNNLIANVLTLDYHPETRVKYTQASGLADWEGDIVGEIDGQESSPWYTTQIPNAQYIEYLSIGNNVTTIGINAFAGCPIISATIPNTVTVIEEAGFAACKSLPNIVIPNSVTRIDRRAFMECINLTSVTISNNVTAIPEFMFYLCKKLSEVTIPNGVTSIGREAFADCQLLANVTIPDSVVSLGQGVFKNTIVTNLTLPSSLRSIGTWTFENCSRCTIFDFRKVTAVPTLANVNAFYGTSASKQIIVPDGLYNTWIAASNWSSSTNNIVNCIVKASQSSLGSL